MGKRKKQKGYRTSIFQTDFSVIVKQLSPIVDRIIRGLGVKPLSKTIYGMGYHELFAEALWILYFHILPGYKAKRGALIHYAAVYWARELRKRLYRSRKRQQLTTPIDSISELAIGMEHGLWNSSFELYHSRMQLIRVTQTLSRSEILLLSDILREGRLTPLRELEHKLGIDHVTLSRIRKRLVEKILDQV